MPRQDQTSVKNAENVPITRQMLTLLENDLAKYGLGGATGATAVGLGIKKGKDTAKLVAEGKRLIGKIEPKITPGITPGVEYKGKTIPVFRQRNLPGKARTPFVQKPLPIVTNWNPGQRTFSLDTENINAGTRKRKQMEDFLNIPEQEKMDFDTGPKIKQSPPYINRSLPVKDRHMGQTELEIVNEAEPKSAPRTWSRGRQRDKLVRDAILAGIERQKTLPTVQRAGRVEQVTELARKSIPLKKDQNPLQRVGGSIARRVPPLQNFIWNVKAGKFSRQLRGTMPIAEQVAETAGRAAGGTKLGKVLKIGSAVAGIGGAGITAGTIGYNAMTRKKTPPPPAGGPTTLSPQNQPAVNPRTGIRSSWVNKFIAQSGAKNWLELRDKFKAEVSNLDLSNPEIKAGVDEFNKRTQDLISKAKAGTPKKGNQ